MANTPAKQETNANQLRPSEKFMDYLKRRATEDVGTRNWEIAASQLDKILSAASMEEMWEADDFQSLGGRDLEDVELQINSFTVHPATDAFEAPLGHYFLVQSQRLDTGEEFTFNTSAPLLMGKMRYMEAQEVLGTDEARCVIRGKDAPKGRVLRLKPIPKRAVEPERPVAEVVK